MTDRRSLCLACAALFAPLADAVAQRERRTEPDAAWRVLAERHDQDRDGVIARDEYTRGAAAFARLDRDGDGRLTAKDFTARRRTENARAELRGFGRALRSADDDGDGTLTRAEWQTWLRANSIEGAVSPLAFGMPRVRAEALLAPFDSDDDGSLRAAELELLFTRLDLDRDDRLFGAELGPVRDPAPELGEIAPDFELPRLAAEPGEGNEPQTTAATLRLSGFAGQRPVALIFGSWT
jgi:hypothetical protein